jgi:electron transport complex protein RnfA
MILASLAVFSGLSLNLILHFALGASGVASDRPGNLKIRAAAVQMGVLFLSVLLLWTVFHYILPPFPGGFSEYFLFFPLSALVCRGLEKGILRAFPKAAGEGDRLFSACTAYDGLASLALFLTCHLALGFAEALALSFFFALGNLAAAAVLGEIRRRSALEWLPRRLRGTPVIFISMGLLSLVCGAAAGICFTILGTF